MNTDERGWDERTEKEGLGKEGLEFMKRGQKGSSVQAMIRELVKAPKPDLRHRKRRESEKETVMDQEAVVRNEEEPEGERA